MESTFTYYAFISYSRKDEAFARKVQHYLEHYKLPSVLCRQFPQTPKSLHPVFRDKTDLPIDNLSDALTDALAASRHLIVLCSKHSACPNDEGKNWVDVEIETFIRLRANHGGRIIPIVLPKSPNAAPETYLPESIRKRDFELTDVETQGEERAYNDVIARMTGLKADVLWERHLRRQRLQKLSRRLGVGMATVLAALTGVWAWDYYAPHTSYYTDYVERHNTPEGLFKLEKADTQARTSHYRFTTRMRRLRMVEHCNAQGELIDHSALWQLERPARMELSYSTSASGDTELTACTHRNARGDLQATLKFSHGNIDISRSKASPHPQNTTALPPRSSVGRLAVERSKEGAQSGLITRELHHRYRSAALVKDLWGTSGRAYERDALGRPTTVRFLAIEDATAKPIVTTPTETPDGVAEYRLSYRDDGQLASISCFNLAGAPALHNGQWATAKPTYGEKGEHLGTEFFDASGNKL